MMKMSNKEENVEKMKVVFDAIINDTKVTLAVLNAPSNLVDEARLEYNRAFKAALVSGALLREKINDYMREQNLWGDEKQKELEKLSTEVNDAEFKLKKGGIPFAEAKELAHSMRLNRFKIAALLAAKNSLDTHSAQGQAEDAQFRKLLQLCLVYNDKGTPVYKDVTTMLASKDKTTNSTEEKEEKVVNKAYDELANMYYRLDPDFDAKLAENKWMKKWGLVDDKFRYINKDGHLVDSKGNLINDKGELVNEKGESVDIHGNKIDDNGEYTQKTQPFLDEKGNPLPFPPGYDEE